MVSMIPTQRGVLLPTFSAFVNQKVGLLVLVLVPLCLFGSTKHKTHE